MILESIHLITHSATYRVGLPLMILPKTACHLNEDLKPYKCESSHQASLNEYYYYSLIMTLLRLN